MSLSEAKTEAALVIEWRRMFWIPNEKKVEWYPRNDVAADGCSQRPRLTGT
jgi:hypothetical protein